MNNEGNNQQVGEENALLLENQNHNNQNNPLEVNSNRGNREEVIQNNSNHGIENNQSRNNLEQNNSMNNLENPETNVNASQGGFNSKEILEISKDFFPALIMSFFLSLALNITENYCDPIYPLILRNCLFFHLGFLCKSIIQIIMIKCSSQKYCQYSLNAMDYILNIAYYIFIIFSFHSYKKVPETCFFLNTFPTVMIFSIITMGIIDICRHSVNFILIIIGFPMMVYYFFKDPADFMVRFGIDHEIIENWPTVKAGCEHSTECVICSEDIKEGSPIMILNCHGKHFFHDTCIKEWLKVKISCPICRSNNVF